MSEDKKLTREELRRLLEEAQSSAKEKEIRENTLPGQRKFENYGPDTEEDIRYRNDD